MDSREVYSEWKRDVLIATLLDRDAEIERLKRRSLDDYVREIIQDYVHSAWSDR